MVDSVLVLLISPSLRVVVVGAATVDGVWIDADSLLRTARSANSSSAAKSNPRAKAKKPTPRHPVSNVSSLLSVSSTSVTEWLSSAARRNPPRMLR